MRQGQGGAVAGERLVGQRLALRHKVLELDKVEHAVTVLVELVEAGVHLPGGEAGEVALEVFLGDRPVLVLVDGFKGRIDLKY